MSDKIRALHAPVEIEPSGTICGECSWQLPNGRWFGKVVEYPCPTLLALDDDPVPGRSEADPLAKVKALRPFSEQDEDDDGFTRPTITFLRDEWDEAIGHE